MNKILWFIYNHISLLGHLLMDIDVESLVGWLVGLLVGWLVGFYWAINFSPLLSLSPLCLSPLSHNLQTPNLFRRSCLFFSSYVDPCMSLLGLSLLPRFSGTMDFRFAFLCFLSKRHLQVSTFYIFLLGPGLPHSIQFFLDLGWGVFYLAFESFAAINVNLKVSPVAELGSLRYIPRREVAGSCGLFLVFWGTFTLISVLSRTFSL